jgi:hypothetical protein
MRYKYDLRRNNVRSYLRCGWIRHVFIVRSLSGRKFDSFFFLSDVIQTLAVHIHHVAEYVHRNVTWLDVLHGIEERMVLGLFGRQSFLRIQFQTLPNQVKQQIYDRKRRKLPARLLLDREDFIFCTYVCLCFTSRSTSATLDPDLMNLKRKNCNAMSYQSTRLSHLLFQTRIVPMPIRPLQVINCLHEPREQERGECHDSHVLQIKENVKLVLLCSILKRYLTIVVHVKGKTEINQQWFEILTPGISDVACG